MDPSVVSGVGITAIISGVLGAKVLFVLLNWSFYWQHPEKIFSLNTLQAGGVFSGGLLAALVACSLYIRWHHLRLLRTADAFAPALAIGHTIGRLGCYAAGCCYGRPTTHFWGVKFTDPLTAKISGTPLGVPLEPVQLFESLIELTNFFILVMLFRKKQFDGQVIATYFLLYGVARFFLEFLRADPGRGEVLRGSFSGMQMIAFFLTLAGLFLLAGRILRNTYRWSSSNLS